MSLAFSKLNRGIHIIGANTKESWTTQGLVKVPTTGKLTQFNLTRGLMEGPQERDLLFIRHEERDLPSTKGLLPFFSCLKKSFGHLESIWVTPWQRGFLTSRRRSLLPFPFKLPYGAISCVHHAPSSWPQAALPHQQRPTPPSGAFPHLLPHPPQHPINKHQVAIGDRTHT